jgi:hypothetical protein
MDNIYIYMDTPFQSQEEEDYPHISQTIIYCGLSVICSIAFLTWIFYSMNNLYLSI